jgi:hypothetical protein
MTLIELHADMSRVADALERIVFLLEKLAFPPLPADIKVHQADLDDLHITTAEAHQRMLDEQQAFAESRQVVPGSEAFMREVINWEREQIELYGKDWKAPQDWKAIFARAAGAAEPARTGRADAGQAEAPAETADRS